VSDGVPVQVCGRCGRRFFPHRLACPACGSRQFVVVAVGTGVVEETTVVHRAAGRSLPRPVRIATVMLTDGLPIVARVDAQAENRAAVNLRMDGGAPVAY
jgi:uncharacterized OB-fold protein